ncbi:MAG: GAF domain-containing protein [Candidatus Eisenbacteria bacterium]
MKSSTPGRTRGTRVERRVWLLGIALSAIYLLIESAWASVSSGEGFLDHMMRPELHEVWARAIAVGAMVLGGIYAQSLVTRRMRAETELQKAKSGLEEVVDLRTAELNTAKESLRSELEAREEDQQRTEATNRLLKLFTKELTSTEYLDKVVELIREWTSSRCVGIRMLDERGNIPFLSTTGYSEEFLESECWLSVEQDHCICTRVILEQLGSGSADSVTPAGSFRCENLSEFVEGLPTEEQGSFRGGCLQNGFASIAAVPIRYRDVAVGAIHLADEREGQVSSEAVEFLESLAPLIGEAGHRFEVEAELRRRHDTETAINALLSLALTDTPLQEVLQRALDQVTSIPWLTLESTGSVFLFDEDAEELVMEVETGLSDSIKGLCARVPLGRCLCGRAAASQETQFAGCVDHRHDIAYEGMVPHGHYCVPIVFDGRTLGVVNLYVKEGHRRDQREEAFLTAMASTLASIILRSQANEEREEAQAQLLQAQKMEAAGTLAAGVAHDFNNLLTAIQGYIDLATMRIDEADPVLADLKQARNASERAAGLTRQLLLFGRKQPVELSLLGLNRTIEDMLKMLNRIIGEDIVVASELDPGLWSVRADAGNLEQVIMNLVVNARDAMAEGGTLTVATENLVLDKVSAESSPGRQPGEYVCLSVTDTGIGMDEETARHIFEPFFTTKDVGKGTGLGLSVAYGIVKQHGGWVSVQSEPGNGTQFKVCLPAFTEGLSESVEEEVSVETSRGGGERILVVEDDDGVRGLAAKALADNGYAVHEATTAEEAMRAFKGEDGAFKVVFSDVVLPGKRGDELADELVALKPELQILLTTGYTDERSHWSALRERGFPLLRKPYSVEELILAVQEAARVDREEQSDSAPGSAHPV